MSDSAVIVIFWLSGVALIGWMHWTTLQTFERLWKWSDNDGGDDEEDDSDWWKHPEDPPRSGKSREITRSE